MLNNRITRQERRKYPRINKRLSLKVKGNTFNLVTETQNLSLSGVYCQIDKDIELMTKVSILLFLPVKGRDNQESTNHVRCKGVVVRVEKIEDGRSNIAVFFNDIKETDKNIIRQYLESHFQPKPALA